MRPDLEQAFINKYVLKAKRSRYLDFRGKLLDMLYHGQDFDKSLLQRLRGNKQQQLDAIFAKARQLKNGDQCYVISVDDELDGKEFSTIDAIDRIVDRVEGCVVLFGNGEGIYYEGEPPHNCYLSL
jgi:hypothetical protein